MHVSCEFSIDRPTVRSFPHVKTENENSLESRILIARAWAECRGEGGRSVAGCGQCIMYLETSHEIPLIYIINMC